LFRPPHVALAVCGDSVDWADDCEPSERGLVSMGA
jgi:hypothetical protein